MSLRVLGSQALLDQALKPWPEVQAIGGHTDVLVDPAKPETVRMGQEMFRSLVTEMKWAAIDTTDKAAPRRVDVLDLDLGVQEMVIIPQIVGG